VGLSGWLVELDSSFEAASLFRYLSRRRRDGELPGQTELVPGAQTLLLHGPRPGLSRGALIELVDAWLQHAGGSDAENAATVTIPTRYDGEDLEELAAMTGLSVRQVIAAHHGSELTVAFCGFVPGFAYLTGLAQELHVPRRGEPRTAVPAGAVGIAAGYTGVYPRSSPGGWHIVGHTAIRLWDERWEQPALLTPGTRVRFVPEQP
jgi:KipI family sensor histidine kinase inhibitor